MREIRFRAWSTVDERIVYWGEFFRHNMNNIFLDPKSCGYELMQFTGLHDKNGKEIWEGDIVIANLKYFDIKNEKCKIVFKNGAFGVQYGYSDDYFKTISAWDSLEVIGNIYDNPELVKP